MNSRLYAKAPIVEALLNVRVEPREEFAREDLIRVYDNLKLSYPQIQDLTEQKITVSSDGKETKTLIDKAYRYISDSQKSSCVVENCGFTFSLLQPYTRWDMFREEAKSAWQIYRDVIKPKKIIRLALRYINRLDLPSPVNEIQDYLKYAPLIPEQFGPASHGYFMQSMMPLQNGKYTMILNEALIPPASPEVQSIVLDIDIFHDIDISCFDPKIWEIYEELRSLKNEVFETCITDNTRGLFQ